MNNSLKVTWPHVICSISMLNICYCSSKQINKHSQRYTGSTNKAISKDPNLSIMKLKLYYDNQNVQIVSYPGRDRRNDCCRGGRWTSNAKILFFIRHRFTGGGDTLPLFRFWFTHGRNASFLSCRYWSWRTVCGILFILAGWCDGAVTMVTGGRRCVVRAPATHLHSCRVWSARMTTTIKYRQRRNKIKRCRKAIKRDCCHKIHD